MDTPTNAHGKLFSVVEFNVLPHILSDADIQYTKLKLRRFQVFYPSSMQSTILQTWIGP